jgi:tetratricopeptide (TPR) repeat protein
MAKKKTRSNNAAEAEEYLRFLASLEGDLNEVSGSGRSKEERQMLAHELLCAAEDAENPIEMIPPLLRAVRLDPACINARLTLLRIAGGPASEVIDELQELLALAEQELGASFIEENRGFFWQLIETRPYMRLRAELAQTLHRAGRMDEAIAQCQAILLLNPNDNQGIRYLAIGLYLEAQRLTEADKLLVQFDEDSAFWLWGRVLERFLTGDLPGATAWLGKARTQNRHVEDFLTGKRKLPSEPEPFYQPGQISEAVMCLGSIGPAWMKSRPAIDWLSSQQRPAARRAGKKRVLSESQTA